MIVLGGGSGGGEVGAEAEAPWVEKRRPVLVGSQMQSFLLSLVVLRMAQPGGSQVNPMILIKNSPPKPHP